MKQLKTKIASFLFLMVLTVQGLWAQCAMCKASAETNTASGDTQAVGINTAVFYVLVICIIILGAMGYVVWKLRNSDELNG